MKNRVSRRLQVKTESRCYFEVSHIHAHVCAHKHIHIYIHTFFDSENGIFARYIFHLVTAGMQGNY